MRRGFSCIELMSVLTMIGVLVSVLTVATAEQRRNAGLGANLSNLKVFGWGTTAYAADFDDRVWSLSWEEGIAYGTFEPASTRQRARANQAIAILRRLTGRDDLIPFSGWFADAFYSPLALVDHLGMDMPARFLASPGDSVRLAWQEDPLNLDLLPPASGFDVEATRFRWAYSASYLLGPAFFSRDRGDGEFGPTISQHGRNHDQYTVPGTALIGRTLFEVAHPSSKVMLHDSHQWHYGPRHLYYAYDAARIPMLFVDGSARVRVTGDANSGFQPNNPNSGANPAGSVIAYRPADWEPRDADGRNFDVLIAHYRYTRAGLKGRDFDGPEVPTE